MKFEWYLTEEELLEANKESDVEDYICGCFYARENGKVYLVDVHHEYYSYAERCFDLEVYESDEDLKIGEWVGSIEDIKTATNLKRFMNRAEKLVESLILDDMMFKK